MNAKQRSLVINLHRGLIFTLTLAGLLMDGYQHSDLLCTTALIVWLWLPLCIQFEANILKRVGTKRSFLLSMK